ncbi:MAG: hypothetical protein J07HQX50_01155 [Haloquadratum sp. J07HQX50]|nr:MAG: hypothetical protein J07HQX50_01155 [Haloquadratum sp. J07HQX50]
MDTVYIGRLTDVLETYWSVETNAKTHNIWAFKQFTERLACTTEEYGIGVEVRSEAWTRSARGSTDRTTRHQDTLTCPCRFRGPCRPYSFRDVPEAAYEQQSQADGTARAVGVGQPRMAGAITLSCEGTSQITAHRPEYRPP